MSLLRPGVTKQHQTNLFNRVPYSEISRCAYSTHVFSRAPAQQAVTNATGLEPSMVPTKPTNSSNSRPPQQSSSSTSNNSSSKPQQQSSSASNGDGGASGTQNDVLSAVTSLLQQSQQVSSVKNMFFEVFVVIFRSVNLKTYRLL